MIPTPSTSNDETSYDSIDTILENLSKDIKNIKKQLDSYNARLVYVEHKCEGFQNEAQMLRSGHMSLIEETQRINKIQLNLEDKYIIMSKEVSELKKEIREIHKSRQDLTEFNKHITVRNFQDINQPRLNERLETVINEDIELTNNKVVNMNILSKDTSNKGVVMVELESIDIKHKIMKQKHLLRKKQYNPPIYIHTATSRMEYKMEVNTKKTF